MRARVALERLHAAVSSCHGAHVLGILQRLSGEEGLQLTKNGVYGHGGGPPCVWLRRPFRGRIEHIEAERVSAVGFADDIAVWERGAAGDAGREGRVHLREVENEMERRLRLHHEVGMPLEEVVLERMGLRGGKAGASLASQSLVGAGA